MHTSCRSQPEPSQPQRLISLTTRRFLSLASALGVRPDRIRLGVGSALLSAALQNAKTTHRCGSASLLVSVNGGPAIALYERAGFTKGARKPSYFANGEDALEMTKGL